MLETGGRAGEGTGAGTGASAAAAAAMANKASKPNAKNCNNLVQSHGCFLLLLASQSSLVFSFCLVYVRSGSILIYRQVFIEVSKISSHASIENMFERETKNIFLSLG